MNSIPQFDPVIHPPGRLQICAILTVVAEAEFAMVRDKIEVSDSVLSKHVKLLEEAGYLKIRKVTLAGRQRTWLAITADGRRAFASHVAELKRLAGLVE